MLLFESAVCTCSLYVTMCLAWVGNRTGNKIHYFKSLLTFSLNSDFVKVRVKYISVGRLCLKCDGTRAETRFLLSVKRMGPFKSAGGRQFSWLLAAEVCASAVVMLDTPCSEVVWRVLAIHSIRQFPLHFSSCASPCVITFQLDSKNVFSIP